MAEQTSPPDNAALPPHNRLGLNYRQVPIRRVTVPGGIIDAHNHAGNAAQSRPMVEAAAAYGITKFWTMTQLENVADLNAAFPGTFHYVAVPGWKRDMPAPNAEFFNDWKRRAEDFYALGARLIKFHAAPGTCKRWGISLDDPRIIDVANFAHRLGYHMMTHVGDPRAWFFGKGAYADGSFGTFESQFAMLERMLERYPDRLHLGAHMGGSLEALDLLARRLERYPHYVVDMSATKWMVRGAAEQSASAVRDFFVAFQDRILFGSDLVCGDKFDWDHHASRYWALQMTWESDYRGESPIDDPDGGRGFDPRTGTFDPARADGKPKLQGVNLPPEVLLKIYRKNAERWLPRA